MAVPYDAITELRGFCLKTAANSKENNTDDKAAQENTVELPRGKDLIVGFAGSNFKLRIQHDELGQPRVFGTGELTPMVFKHSGNFVLALSARKFGQKFDFFGLPAEVRNMIYGLIFQASPNPPYTPWNPLESSKIRPEKFERKRALKPVRFRAKIANLDCGISFINKQALSETTPFILRSRQYQVCGTAQVHALFASMGPEGLSTWTGPLTLDLKARELRKDFDHRWLIFDHLKKGEHSTINRINIVTKRRGFTYHFIYPPQTALGRLLESGRGKFGRDFKIYFHPSLGNKDKNHDVHSQFEHALRGESWDGGYLDTGGEFLLVQKVYETIEEGG
ncbi:hypothetical protein IWX90DRAFT_487350 [Phyllosticta citrichinensis]|uniref:Uncharacterized protein n=1 Tax=Phyllosticta citrichinensis TaxID=1130410 RepID=A0ABR1XRB4_9PEZI